MSRDSSDELITKVRDVVNERLDNAGVNVHSVDGEPVKGTKLCRFYVLAQGFEALSPLERQSLVWDAIEKELTTDQQLGISIIYTLTPREAGVQEDASDAA